MTNYTKHTGKTVWIEQEKERAKQVLCEAEQTVQTVLGRLADIDAYERVAAEFDALTGTARDAQAAEPEQSDQPSLLDLDLDMTGATNVEQRAIIFANATVGDINVLEFSEWLIAKGFSKAQLESLRAHVHNALSDSVFFEKNGVNRFRLVRESEDLMTASGSESVSKAV